MLETMVIGYLGKDAEIRNVGDKKVINFSVAHTDKWTNKQGVKEEKTTWIECSVWDKEKVAPYLKKGTMVLCKGVPDINVWNDKDTGIARGTLQMTVFDLRLIGGGKDENKSETAAAATN